MQKKQKKPAMHIDINATKNCNLRCSYCYEVKEGHVNKGRNYEDPKSFIKFVNGLMSSERFKEVRSGVQLNFWGGEATTNKELFKTLIDEWVDNSDVNIFMYSNGFYIDDWWMDMFSMLQSLPGNRFTIQISFDGRPIHDFDRVTVSGGPSSGQILETMDRLKDRGIRFSNKSTITPENFKYMFDAYVDVISNGADGQNYFPTIDLHKVYDGDEYKEHGRDLYESLIKISTYELKQGHSKMALFRESKALCSAGAHMIAVDVNGNVLPCHGALYANYDEHKITNVSDDNAVEKVINSMEWYETFYRNQPDECKECTVNFCLRCPIVKFQHSEIETYEERWTDYTNQDYQCYYYGIIDLVYRAHTELRKQQGK